MLSDVIEKLKTFTNLFEFINLKLDIANVKISMKQK